MQKLQEILAGKHPTYQTAKLKKLLLQHGLKENKCEKCGITEWCGEPIVIQLDHVNGRSDDHRLENLRMLCPNCHSQTETYGGRNRKNEKLLKLEDKFQARRDAAKAARDAVVAARLQDLKDTKMEYGWVAVLADKWKVSHTQVARFVKQNQ